MPISATGQSIPQRPTAPDFSRLFIFEDFIYSNGAPALFTLAGTSGGTMGNPAGADPLHPGVFSFDVSGGGATQFTYLQNSASQGLSPQIFSELTLEWVWQLNQSPGAQPFQVSMGASNSNGCGLGANQYAMQFSTAGVCAVHPNFNIWFCSTAGGVEVDVDTGVTIASLIGSWVNSRVVWNRAAQSLTLFLNGVQRAQIIANAPVLAAVLPMFGFATFANLGGINAGTRILFDYVSLSGSISR